MRMLLFSLLVLQYLITGTCSAIAGEKIKDEYLIRRAYLDVLNVVPTIEEIDWYVVYNTTNSYQLAVDFLLSRENKKWNIDNQIGRVLLMSEAYKNMPLRALPKETIEKCVMYVVGDLKNNYTQENVNNSIKKLIELSEKTSNDQLDRIDYICNCLMSRTTTLEEANSLLTIFKNEKNEQVAWYKVVNRILQLPDVCCK